MPGLEMKYLILSDIHANFTALQAVLAKAESALGSKEEVHIYFLGDLMGYGPLKDAVECVRWLHERKHIHWVIGNHDEWILKPIASVSREAKLTLLSQRYLLEHKEYRDDWQWFSSQVEDFLACEEDDQVLFEKITAGVLCFTHGSADSHLKRMTYLWPWNAAIAKADLERLRKRHRRKLICLFHGHTHFPVFVNVTSDKPRYMNIRYGEPLPLGDGLVAINPGSVGQPRDGDPRAAFAVLDPKEQMITFHRAEYDIKTAVNKINGESNFASRRHPLTFEERSKLSKLLGGESEIEKSYAALIRRLETADGGSQLAEYGRIYNRTLRGLRVISQSKGKNT